MLTQRIQVTHLHKIIQIKYNMAQDISQLYISESFQALVQRSSSGQFYHLASAYGAEFIPISSSYAITASYVDGISTPTLKSVLDAGFSATNASASISGKDGENFPLRVIANEPVPAQGIGLLDLESNVGGAGATTRFQFIDTVDRGAEMQIRPIRGSGSINSSEDLLLTVNGTYSSGDLILVPANQTRTDAPISSSVNIIAQSFTGSLDGDATSATTSTLAATASLLQGNAEQVQSIDMEIGGVPAEQRLTWNDNDGTVDIGLKGGNVTLQVGQEEVARVVNKDLNSGALLEANWQVVRILGSQGQRLSVTPSTTSDGVIPLGIVTEDIAFNAEGYVTTAGLVRGIDTRGGVENWQDGDQLYLRPSSAGGHTNIKPTAPTPVIKVGTVVNAAVNGSIFVNIDVGESVGELDDTTITSATAGDLLVYNNGTSVWENSQVLGGEYTINIANINSASIGYLQTISGSATIIGDAFIVLNNDTPTQRYAGVAVFDSGSIGVTSSFQFDGQTNDWFYEYSDDGGVTTDHGVTLFGPEYTVKGSPTYPTNNRIQKGDGGHHLLDSTLTDTGTEITTTVGITAPAFSGSLVGNAATATSASYALTASYLDGAIDPFPFTGSAEITGSLKVIGGVSLGNLGGNNSINQQNQFVVGQSNTITGGSSVIVGGEQNNVSPGYSGVFAGANNNVSGGDTTTIIGGYQNENAGGRATILGGEQNTINGSANHSVIVGGTGNEIEAGITSSVILGGSDLYADENNTAYSQNLYLFGKAVNQVTPVSVLANTASLDLNQSNTFSFLANANTYVMATNINAGQVINLQITQNGAGTGTLTFDTVFKFPGGTAPTLTVTPDAIDLISAISYTGQTLIANATQDYS